MTRERLLAKTFVELADALVDGGDVIELLDTVAARCVRLFEASACGIVLADTDGHFQVIATSSEQAGLLELLRLQNDEGPCLETFQTGRAVVNAHLDTAIDEWPRFATAALDAGYTSVQTVPMRLRFQVIGALNLFHADARESSIEDLALAQALADVATIGLLQTRTRHPEAALAEQLQAALTSRVIIEQAKGVVAERRGVELAVAFDLLRGHARRHGLPLTGYARAVAEGSAVSPDVPATQCG